MPRMRKISLGHIPDDLIVRAPSGESFLIKDRGQEPQLQMDPRIDLTKPIWEQAQRLAAKDRIAETRTRKSKSAVHAA